MRFLSDDGRVFNTEKECSNYEKQLENAEKEWQQMYQKVYRIYNEFCKTVNEYGEIYGFKEPVHYPRIEEFMDNLKIPKNIVA